MTFPKAQFQSVTLLDVQLARVYLPYLVALARERKTCTYTELVDLAKIDHPDLPDVQKAIAVSTGRRLDVIKHYCEDEGLPDLASIVVGKASGECGSFPGEHLDPAAARAEVFAKDWSEIFPSIEVYFDNSTKRDAPRKTRKEQATKLMSEHYKLHRARYPTSITGRREQIIQMLMGGMEPEEAFASVVAQLSR